MWSPATGFPSGWTSLIDLACNLFLLLARMESVPNLTETAAFRWSILAGLCLSPLVLSSVFVVAGLVSAGLALAGVGWPIAWTAMTPTARTPAPNRRAIFPKGNVENFIVLHP